MVFDTESLTETGKTVVHRRGLNAEIEWDRLGKSIGRHCTVCKDYSQTSSRLSCVMTSETSVYETQSGCVTFKRISTRIVYRHPAIIKSPYRNGEKADERWERGDQFIDGKPLF